MPILSTAQPARHPEPTVKASGLACLIFDRPDLEKAKAFLTDFGLQPVSASNREVLFLRGTGAAPFCYVARRSHRARFVGFGLLVDSREDLQRLTAIDGASRIEALAWPGGGERVRLTDPSGFEVHAIHGQAPVPLLPHRGALPVNDFDQSRRVNRTQRPPVAPPEVIRPGHVALAAANYQATLAWYCRHFGFIPSDVQLLPDGSPAVSFLRLDLGDRPADHHTLALAQGFAPEYNHSAYEVIDADAVGMGQRLLRERGWKHAWGMGRHILGSQIFDYWQDPWGDKHEHYCDGDLFTADTPTGTHEVSREAMSQWGPDMPARFVKPALTPSLLMNILRNLRRSPDLTISKLVMLARIFG